MFRKSARPRHGTIVAYLALFVALGGTSYAAVSLSRNDVRSKHIKNGHVKKRDIAKNAVNSRRVKDGTLLSKDFKPGELVSGAPGPQGPKGDTGAKGDKGDKGDTGEAGPLLATLPSGKTLVGQYYALDDAEEIGDWANDTISYQFPLAASPTPHYRPPAAGPTANCPGTYSDPQAAPGHLCVYSGGRSGTNTTYSVDGVEHDRVNRFGAALNVRSSAATGYFFDVGTWAVTAP